MRIFGIDFTSTPTKQKPIVAIEATLQDGELTIIGLHYWISMAQFEQFLASEGPWFAGCDFPFAQSRRLISNLGLGDNWLTAMHFFATLNRADFRALLDDYRYHRPAGDKEHRRCCDSAAGAISPQKLYGVPVGLMFFEGATRLANSEVCLPGLRPNNDSRVAIETYPALIARRYIGKRSYKQDSKAKQTVQQCEARSDLWHTLMSPQLTLDYGVRLHPETVLPEDPSGDTIDALLCAIQAAWAFQTDYANSSLIQVVDTLEGWIADPSLMDKLVDTSPHR